MKRELIKILFYSSIFCLLCLNYSCESFVDITPPTMARQDQYFKTQADFTAAVNGAYGGLRSYYGSFYVLAEIPSDNTEHNGYNLGHADMDRMTWLSNNTYIQSNWLTSYSIIARTNTILDRIDGVIMDVDLKEQYKGETKFIRALIYFNLVQFFGEVPLSIHEIKTEEEAYTLLREPVNKIYTQIEKDLSEAIEALPPGYTGNNIGRATQGAAQSLLGKVYVTRNQYDKAIPILKSVIDADRYTLLPDYEDVFSTGNENNEEIIFAVQYSATGYGEGSNFCIAFAPWGSGTEITTGASPSGANEGTTDLLDAFEVGDLRKNTAIVVHPVLGSRYTCKFLDRPATGSEGKNDWPVLRYPDVLLLCAEALNESGQTAEAAQYINEVRDRAGLPALSGLNKDEMRLAIEQERRVELCFEGHRWLDLLRTGRMFEVMTAYQERGEGYGIENYEVTKDKALFPIPFRERSLNPNLTQNNGYN